MDKTTFKTILLNDMTFGVEVLIPGRGPYVVEPFANRAEAERWIGDRLRLKDISPNATDEANDEETRPPSDPLAIASANAVRQRL